MGLAPTVVHNQPLPRFQVVTLSLESAALLALLADGSPKL